jgi:hypothetical protein
MLFYHGSTVVYLVVLDYDGIFVILIDASIIINIIFIIKYSIIYNV